MNQKIPLNFIKRTDVLQFYLTFGLLLASQVSSIQSEEHRFLSQNATIIKLNKLYDGTLIGQGTQDWSFYTLNLSDQGKQALSYKDEKTDLVVQLNQNGDYFTDSSLFINLNEQEPNETHFQMRCSFFGEDFCVINGKELKDAQVITIGRFFVLNLDIGVYCRDHCDYRLQAELTEELLFNPGKSHKLYFLANQERIIRFQIPDDANITTIEIQGVNQNKYDKFNMIMTQGNVLPNSDNSLYLRPAWENGYVGKFTEDCFCFCRGCNYTVLVSSEKEGYITVGAKVSGQTIDITSTDGIIYDSVLNFHTQCYSYKVTNDKKDLRIKLESFAGDPDVYVNPLSIPPLLGLSAFNSRDHFENEELILTADQRSRQNATKGLYYICVFGQQAATYKLTVKNEDHDIYLTSGLSESGYVQNNETNIHYFKDPILADPDVELQFSLHVMVGKARLESKVCAIKAGESYESFKKTCNFTTEELLYEDPNEQIQQHIGSESEKSNTSICKLQQANKKRGPEITCVYVVGIIGLAEFETHYSVMLKTNKKAEYIFLKQGIPVAEEMKEAVPKYFNIKINDPQVKRLTIQLTTIHGDPDMFISRTSKTPSFYDFETRSIRCGMYPEIIQYIRNEEDPIYKTLVGDYYVAVFGYVQSTFSLVYFVESEGGIISTVQLMTAQKQKGVLKTTNDSMVYEFSLSNSLNEDVEIRLHSENGNFDFYLGQGYIPNETTFNATGNEHLPIIFRQENATDFHTTYYVKVKPYQLKTNNENQTTDSAGMAYVYTIAFYEQNSFIHLQQSVPLRGQINNETFHYFYFDVSDNSTDYEITLTSISGNPDLVLSMDKSNKFPNRLLNDFMSANQFATDSILISQDSLNSFQKKTGKQVSQLFVGVFTNDKKPSTYTILVSQKDSFSPILLTNGQIQQGFITLQDEKFYYFKTGSDMPAYATLLPKTGNPDLSISIIKNFSESKYEWKKYADKPQFQSKVQFGADIIYLSTNDTAFTQGCGASCILLLKVTNANKEDETHYSLSITRDILELVENNQIQDTIQDQSQYKYYRFYKSCVDCDVEVTVTPLQSSTNFLLMADYDVKNTLPNHQNKPKWLVNAFQQSTLKIQSDELMTNKGVGMYTIGVHSHYNTSYLLSVQTLTHDSTEDYLKIKKVFIGETQDLDFDIREVKYFYFENWNNATLNFQFLPLHNTPSKIRNIQFDFRVTTIKAQKYVPQYDSEIVGIKWKTNTVLNQSLYQNTFTDTLMIDHTTTEIEFCVQCIFIIRIENQNKKKQQNGRLVITQDNEHGGLGFKSNLIIGRPYILKLGNHKQSQFNFILNEGSTADLDVQYFTGQASYEIKDWTDNSIYYPDTYLDPLLLTATSTVSTLNLKLRQLISGRVYQLIIKAQQDLHASILLSVDSDLTIISDSVVHSINVNSNNSIENRYFTYLPPSQKFQLAVSAFTNTFGIKYNINIKQFSTKPIFTSNKTQGGNRLLQKSNRKKPNPQDIASSFKNMFPTQNELLNSMRNKLQEINPNTDVEVNMNSNYWQRYIFEKEFDFTLKSSASKNGMEAYDAYPIIMDDDENILLIKVSIIKGDTSQADLQLTFSGSEVQLLIPGSTVRGHVSNWNQTLKIYEVFINQNSLFENETSDLFIKVTPCNGKVDFFVSEEYITLFHRSTQIQPLELVSDQKFGLQTSRVKNMKGKEVIYIGIQSSNEFYKDIAEKIDSYFEIETKIIRGTDDDIMDSYAFKDSVKEIEIKYDQSDDSQVIISWSQLFYKQTSKQIGDTKFVPVKDVVYQMFAGTQDNTRHFMSSQCSIEHADMSKVFALYMNLDDMKDNQITLKRKYFEQVKVIGLIAKIKDPNTGEVVNLAYEPFRFDPENFGVKINSQHLMLVILIGIVAVVILVLIVCFLRKKSQRLEKRLEHEVKYVQQNFSQIDAQNSQSHRDDSRDDI